MHQYIRKWNNHVAPIKLTLIKIAPWLEKMQVFMALFQRPENGKNFPKPEWSTVRGSRKRYEAKIKDALRKKKSPKKVIVKKLRGRPCLLGDKIDPLTQNYLKATRYKEGVVNSGGNSDCKSLTEAISMSRKRKFNNRKILGSKSFSTWALFAVSKSLRRYIFWSGLKRKQSWNSCIKSLIKLRNIKFRPPWSSILIKPHPNMYKFQQWPWQNLEKLMFQ